MFRIFSFILCLMVSATFGLAQSKQMGFGNFRADSKEAITIAADTMTLDEAARTAKFQGAVVIEQGNTKLSADAVTVEYVQDSDQITIINAQGNVVLNSGADIARADSAVYSILDNEIKLTGNAFVQQASNTLRAQGVTINTATGGAVMTGRVTTTLTPQGQ